MFSTHGQGGKEGGVMQLMRLSRVETREPRLGLLQSWLGAKRI